MKEGVRLKGWWTPIYDSYSSLSLTTSTWIVPSVGVRSVIIKSTWADWFVQNANVQGGRMKEEMIRCAICAREYAREYTAKCKECYDTFCESCGYEHLHGKTPCQPLIPKKVQRGEFDERKQS